MGDIGSSNLYGQYSDYQSLSLDFGVRQYGDINPKVRGYGEALIGLGFVDKTDVTLAAPGANLTQKANDFYDQTAALALGVNVGVLVQTRDTVGFFGQIGIQADGRHDRDRQPPGHRPRNHQRQQLTLDSSLHRRHPGAVLG